MNRPEQPPTETPQERAQRLLGPLTFEALAANPLPNLAPVIRRIREELNCNGKTPQDIIHSLMLEEGDVTVTIDKDITLTKTIGPNDSIQVEARHGFQTWTDIQRATDPTTIGDRIAKLRAKIFEAADRKQD